MHHFLPAAVRINTNGDPELGARKNVVAFVLSIRQIFHTRAASFKSMESLSTLTMQTARPAWKSRAWCSRHTRGTSVTTALSASISSAMGCGCPRRHSNSWRRRAILNGSDARWQRCQLSDGKCVTELQGTRHRWHFDHGKIIPTGDLRSATVLYRTVWSHCHGVVCGMSSCATSFENWPVGIIFPRSAHSICYSKTIPTLGLAHGRAAAAARRYVHQTICS